MALADTHGISGGDHSPWAWPLVAASALAVLALVAPGVRSLRRARARVAAASALSGA
ncbi:hypothetical protein Dac01nite_03390 [Demequina activiva]|uniref:Uncharacterized protein n=1 Tax=Demequina activiva TaxID=1582364 RepID=A0A919Q011_9MICO|nr:hypothetical protein Dac01nite_03390 [Demequina activiva]